MDSSTQEVKNLLINAKSEIQQLRRQNEVLAAQVGVIEVFAAATGTRQGNSGAMVDVAYELQRMIAKLEASNG